jgi:hypothetical protein
MLPAGWDAVVKAAERMAPTMNAQNAANTLNASWTRRRARCRRRGGMPW